MEAKKIYSAPKTEVVIIQSENMCEESSIRIVRGSLDDDITSGNMTKERGIDSGFGDLW